ncbi:hypothetical protein E2C01_055442 [Portunus trituberculatus]|uniref:Uncharacterized protein n=1 Tax=Portunus trituberculatus TaxID=210409 RepID=A0A5B7GMQ2_PORTR|nr:hypothetical protein [Portunus trituberculatus]
MAFPEKHCAKTLSPHSTSDRCGGKEATAPDFLAKSQLPGNESQSSFTIPALTEYVGDSERDWLLCPVRAIREYFHKTRDCYPRCSRLFVTVTEPWCVVHPHTISHWICQVIQRSYEDVSEEDMHLVQVKAHEVRAVAMSALFKKILSIPAILQAGTWKRRSKACTAIWTLKLLSAFSSLSSTTSMKSRSECTTAVRSASVITFGTGESSSTSSLAANSCSYSTKSSALRSSAWDWTSSAMSSTLMVSSPSAVKRAELASSAISCCRSS